MTDESEKADIVDRLRMAAQVCDVPFYYDDAGKMVFHDDTMEEAATEIASLRRELAEARAEIARCHARLEIEHYFTMGEEGEFVRHEMTMEERVTFPDAVTCRDATIAALQMDIEETRADTLEEAATYIEQVNGSIPDRQEHAAAIRNLAGDQP